MNQRQKKLYVKQQTKEHKMFSLQDSGFYICKAYPFIGASPDGLVECKYCGEGLLEIKCPWTYRGLSIKEYAAKSDSCLADINGKIQLDINHPYWAQVQCQ